MASTGVSNSDIVPINDVAALSKSLFRAQSTFRSLQSHKSRVKSLE